MNNTGHTTNTDDSVEPYSNAGDAIVKTTMMENVGELFREVGDKVFDVVDHTEALDGVPILGWLHKAAKTTRAIRDMVLLKKVVKFLEGVGDIPDTEREEFAKKIDDDPKYRKNIGETLILLLERHDSFEKSLMLGKVYAALVRNKIERDGFDLISESIDRANVVDLKSMYEKKKDSEWSRRDNDREIRLYQAGLYKMEVSLDSSNLDFDGVESYPVNVHYAYNDIGNLFVEIMTGRIYRDEGRLF